MIYMKGQNLPINTVIVITIASIVFVVIISLFASSWSGSSKQIGIQTSWNEACSKWSRQSCNKQGFEEITIIYHGEETTVEEMCKIYIGYTERLECKEICCGKSVFDEEKPKAK